MRPGGAQLYMVTLRSLLQCAVCLWGLQLWVGTWCLYSLMGVGELQLAIIVELLPRGILHFHGHRQAFTMLLAFDGVCCSWDIVGGSGN